MLEDIWQFILIPFKTPLLRGYAFALLIGGAVGLWIGIRIAVKATGKSYPENISAADWVKKSRDELPDHHNDKPG